MNLVTDDSEAPPPLPPPLPKRDMTLDQLHKHDGKGQDGRVCLAVCGKIFDVTKGRLQVNWPVNHVSHLLSVYLELQSIKKRVHAIHSISMKHN